MPLYGVAQAGSNPTAGLNLCAVGPGDSYTLFNAETVTAPQSSVAINRAAGGDTDAGMTFSISFVSAPTASVLVQGSNQDVEAQYQTLYTSTNKQFDFYTDTARWAFYRVKVNTQSAGGAITATVQR